MTLVALGLVLASAGAHGTWNFIAKRVESDAVFLWLFTFLGFGIYAPLALGQLLWQRPSLGLEVLGLMAVSAVLHVAYFVFLGRGYRAGDLTVVYPLARGTGPLLATLAAIPLLGEVPGPFALAGALLVLGGIFSLTGDPRGLRRSGSHRAVAYALLTGLFISAYTLWDKHAVAQAHVPPIIYEWGVNAGRVAILTPWALTHRSQLVACWRAHRGAAAGVAVLSPLAYILVLFAFTIAPVYLVATTRELGVLVGAVLGVRVLGEGRLWSRLAAGAAVVAGVALLALA